MNDEKILVVRELRWQGRVLQQKLLIQKDGKDVEEWRDVPIDQECVDPESKFWSSLDWNKTNLDLAKEHGHSTTYISQKRSLYGRRSFKHTRVSWEGVDWTKSNSQIARELGRTIQMVAAAKHARDIPPHRQGGMGRYNYKIDAERLAAVDWEWETDASIAVNLGVSRERIRQIRVERQKPDCKVKWTGHGVEAMKWLEEHRAEIEGLPGHDIVRMMPGEAQIPTKYSLLKRSGIKFTKGWGGGRPWKYGEHGQVPLNWVLPTKWLSLVWGMSNHQVSQRRMLINAGPSRWHGGGFSRYLNDPDFRALLAAEILVAKEKGLEVDTNAIDKEMEFQKAAVARISQKAKASMALKRQTKL